MIAHAASARFRQDGLDSFVEPRIVSRGGIGGSRLLRDRNRPLGKALEHDDVELAALDQLDRRLDAVAGIPAPQPMRIGRVLTAQTVPKCEHETAATR